MLSGGGFPVRGSFALGETLEPVRTFLSTRESRAYAAIERANRTLQPQSIATVELGDLPIPVMANVVKTTSLTNRFYDMPLGWTLSDRTRDIIARQSGRYWDCDPDENFEQTGGFPATDCIQLLVHHELNRSLAEAGTAIGRSKYASSLSAWASRGSAIRSSSAATATGRSAQHDLAAGQNPAGAAADVGRESGLGQRQATPGLPICWRRAAARDRQLQSSDTPFG